MLGRVRAVEWRAFEEEFIAEEEVVTEDVAPQVADLICRQILR